MKRSRLKNIESKTKHPNNIQNHKRQQNYVFNLNKNAKFEYLTDTTLRIVNLSG